MSDIYMHKDKVVIVTGGALGIGRGIVELFAELGAKVLAVDINEEALKKMLKETESKGKVVGMVQDLTQKDAPYNIVKKAVDEYGTIDILVNNAGIYPMTPFVEADPPFFEKILALNVNSVVFLTQAVAKYWIEKKIAGNVVTIASIDAFHCSGPGLWAYDTSKAAVVMLTRSLSVELADHNIRVNAVCPGGILTEGTGMKDLPEEQRTAIEKSFLAKIPLKRMGTPKEIAGPVAMIASEAGSYITGQTLIVDGGVLQK